MGASNDESVTSKNNNNNNNNNTLWPGGQCSRKKRGNVCTQLS